MIVERPFNEGLWLPVVQPFLTLKLEGNPGEHTNHYWWQIDVGGRMDDYLRGHAEVLAMLGRIPRRQLDIAGLHHGIVGEGSNWLSRATPKLQELLDRISAAGGVVRAVYAYSGSFGRTHIWHDDFFYTRKSLAELEVPHTHGEAEPDELETRLQALAKLDQRLFADP
jgi:hypothetical protein